MSEDYDTKTVLLTAPGKPTVIIELTRKFGVWFIMKASGGQRTSDFANTGKKDEGWGITETAIARCAKRMGYTIFSEPPGPQKPAASVPQIRKVTQQQRQTRESSQEDRRTSKAVMALGHRPEMLPSDPANGCEQSCRQARTHPYAH